VVSTGNETSKGYEAMPFDDKMESGGTPGVPQSGYKRFNTSEPGVLVSKLDTGSNLKSRVKPYSLVDPYAAPEIRPSVYIGGGGASRKTAANAPSRFSRTNKAGLGSPNKALSSPDSSLDRAQYKYARQNVRSTGGSKRDKKVKRKIRKDTGTRKALRFLEGRGASHSDLSGSDSDSSGSDSSSASASSSDSSKEAASTSSTATRGRLKPASSPAYTQKGDTDEALEVVQDSQFPKPVETRVRHQRIARKVELDQNVASNYFGNGNGDWGTARESFYGLHQQLNRQKAHFTKEQYDKLLVVQSDLREDAALLEMKGFPQADIDEDERSILNRLTDASPHKEVLHGRLGGGGKQGEEEGEAGAAKEGGDDDDFNIDYLREIAGHFGQASSRTKFLYGCIQARDGLGLPPRLGPIVRKSRTVKIDLSHQGMGDELGCIFAAALSTMPFVQRINIQDNRLSDVGVEAVLRSIMDKKDIVSLVIGFNKVDGDAAECLGAFMADPECPLLELGLSNADIDDGECCRFVEALATNKNLTHLDMSNNLIGSDENLNVVNPDLITGGEAIAALLASPACNIKTLNLRWNLIRFNSAVEIGESLAENNSLEHLNIAYNAFGAEGGMALGQSIIENCTLKTLDIRNNGITPQAGFCIAVALRQNLSLVDVDLSGNPLGEIGGKTFMSLPMELGDRLQLNIDGCNFKTQDAKCWFDPEAPSGLYSQESFAAREEIVNKETTISQKSCDIIIGTDPHLESSTFSASGKAMLKDPDTIRVQLEEVKNQLNPMLDLSKPYDRAVLIELLRFVAEKDGCALVNPESNLRCVDDNFAQMLFYDDEGTKTTVSLQRVILTSMEGGGDEELAQWIESGSARAIFKEFDLDGSGEIDRLELAKVFERLGKGSSESDIDRVLTQFDVDGSGSIEEDEFIEFLMQLRDEISEMRVKKMFMALPGEVKPWRPPPSGKVEFRCLYNPRLSAAGEGKATNTETLDRVLSQVKKTSGDSSDLLQMSLALMRLGPDEAQRVFDELLKVEGDRVKVLKIILPVMGNPQQARVFVDLNLKDKDPYRPGTKASVLPKDGFGKGKVAKIVGVNKSDPDLVTVLYLESGNKEEVSKASVTLLGEAAVSAETEKRRLQGVMGNAYYPIMGIPSGHYRLDLTKEMDRMCLAKLAAINNTETNKRRKQRNGDTSQKGNWMNFRNETFRGNPYTISPWFLDPVPKQGLLEFDYISTSRPDEYVMGKDEPALTESRFLSVIFTGFDIPEKDEHGKENAARKEEEARYDELSKHNLYEWMHGLWTPTIRNAGKDGFKFGNELAVLYGEVNKEIIEDIEEKVIELRGRPGSSGPTTAAEPDEGNDNRFKELSSAAAQGIMLAIGGGERAEGSRGVVDFPDTTKLPKFKPGNPFSIALKEKPHSAALQTFSKMKRLSQLMKLAAKVQMKAKKRVSPLKLLQQIQDMVCMKWINALQARFLVDKFTKLIGISQDDTKYKLNLVVTLHSRIIDLYNFDLVLGALNPEEQAAIFYRVGWLNAWSPLKPDTYYELTESRREERLVSKALLHLAVEEPGTNWWDETFQWNRSDRCIPGWELPITWFTEEGMPSKGVLKLTYYSGEGKGLEDCEPRWRLRHAISGMVLAEPPKWLKEDHDGHFKSALGTAKDPLSCAQMMLLSGGIKLNYRQKNNPVKANKIEY